MYKSIEDRYIELIEKAKQHSKEKFLSFVTGIYSVNPSLLRTCAIKVGIESRLDAKITGITPAELIFIGIND